MRVPSPVPSGRPWSPVGYQVVEMPPTEGTSAVPTQAPSAQARARAKAQRFLSGTFPSPSIDEPSYDEPLSIKLPPLPPIQRRGSGGAGVWIGLAASGFLVMLMIAAVGVAARNLARMPAVAVQAQMNMPVRQQVVLPQIPAEGPAAKQRVDIPEAAVPVPAAKPLAAAVVGPKEDCEDGCKVDQGAKRETFGTTVQFVRSPLEAARSADKELKLTFLLHVSGNFEDSKFT